MIAFTQLRIIVRSRATVLFMLVPGIVLYTIFTTIFSGAAGRPFRVAVIDMDQTKASARLIAMLRANNVKVITHEDEDPSHALLTPESARDAILHEGLFRVALVIPKGYSKSPTVVAGGNHYGVDMVYDESQPLEAEIVSGMVQMAAGRALFERFGGAMNFGIKSTEPDGETAGADGAVDSADESGAVASPKRLIEVHPIGVVKSGMPNAAKNSFLAAIVPMFILFGAAGAARGMLESLRKGEIRRMLAAPIGAVHIISGQLITAFVVSFAQCYVMYLYAWLVFQVAIWDIAAGLFVLTAVTCAAATALGMLMAAFCRTGEQLDAMSSVIILAMSAIGGSMVPRFVMPLFMQKLGLFTINGWAYDGIMALIRHEGFAGIVWPCLVLLGASTAFLAISTIVFSKRLADKPTV